MKFTIRDLIWLTTVCALVTMYAVEGYNARCREIKLRGALEAMRGFRSMVEQSGWIEIVASVEKATSRVDGPKQVTIRIDEP